VCLAKNRRAASALVALVNVNVLDRPKYFSRTSTMLYKKLASALNVCKELASAVRGLTALINLVSEMLT
jgi:hypothetical protein